MEFNETALLASIDEALATVRAALAAAGDPEQTQEAITQLSARAGSHMARLPTTPERWEGVSPQLLEAIAHAQKATNDGDLVETEQRLAAAREMLGGPSR